jgi:hypothetical protein
MASRPQRHYLDHALHIPPASPGAAIVGLAGGCALLAAAIWLGGLTHGQLNNAEPANARQLRVVDAERALIFDADVATGDVRVLNVRSGVSEIARLHENQRQSVAAIALDARRQVLTVETADERYQYDAQTFRLLARSPLLLAGPDT